MIFNKKTIQGETTAMDLQMRIKIFGSLKKAVEEINPQTLAGIAVSSKGEVKIVDVDFEKITKITRMKSPIMAYDERDVWIGNIQIGNKLKIVELYGNSRNHLAYQNAIVLANKMAQIMWVEKISNAFFPIHFNHPSTSMMQHEGIIKKIPSNIGNLRILENGIICADGKNIRKFSIENQRFKLVWNNKRNIHFIGRASGNKIPITFSDGESAILTVLNQPAKGIMSAFIDKKIPIIETVDKYIGKTHINGISIAISKGGEEIIFYPVSF